ncbi:dienelactone hydrolase [Cercophora newfieldiana]|uniref:Dienelactone hydrolase n=1 Tax=Cercophora newfieldiana TaxID=92897 RepID=A0AA39Y5U8_9PEZI|nr:dienelactone hydrolase [Cercophora newfieldiana]
MTTPSDPSYLANPPSACCFTGTLHAGTPRGTVEDILSIPTYISRPTTSNGNIILYLPDVWGLSPNAKLLMDGYAAAGYLVLGIDYFRGDPISNYRRTRNDPPPPDFDHPAWLAKHFAFASAHVLPWAAAVREKFGTSPTIQYACVGYCFGAPFVCQLLATDEVSAGAFAHPSRLTEEHFVGVKHPLLLSCAETDGAFPPELRRKAVDVLQREKKVYHVQLFQGVSHGFASRGDLDDPYEKWCKEQSHSAIVSWFDLWLAKS